jgi:hypothetical protein
VYVTESFPTWITYDAVYVVTLKISPAPVALKTGKLKPKSAKGCQEMVVLNAVLLHSKYGTSRVNV